MPIRADVKHGMTGARAAVGSLLHLHEQPAAAVDACLGDDRTVFLPSAALSLGELHAALLRVVAPLSIAAWGRVVEKASTVPSPLAIYGRWRRRATGRSAE